MKLTSRIECILLVISVWATNLLQFCHPEPYFSSNGNISPVKLINLNFRNRPSLAKHEGKVFGSAKISRIVPVKGVKNVKHLRDTKKSELSKNKAQTLSTTKEPNTILGEEPSKIVPAQVFQRSRRVSEDEDHKSNKSSTYTIKTSTTTSTNLPSDSSWDYLNTIKMDNELGRGVSGLSEETLNNNVTLIAQTDPTAEGNFFMQNVINDLSIMKSTRMIDVPEKKKGTGIRFSAKMKPVLNVKKPIRGTVKGSGKLPKVSLKDINHHSISGHLSNNVVHSEDMDETEMKNSELGRDFSDEYSSGSSKKSYNFISTTPSLLHVLTVPEAGRFISTTSTPSASSDSKRVFIPVIPVSEMSTSQRAERKNSEGSHPPTARKPRGPPKDGEYSIPSITTTIGPAIAVSKGYQTIAELSTFGPKVIWYNHNQTPEDTFYPNTDDFLMPPEESSIEILTDLSLKPMHDNSPTEHVSFIPSKVSVPLLKPSHNGKHDFSFTSSNTPENGSIPSHSRSNRGGSLFSENRKPNNSAHLQHAAASDHNRIRDNDGSHDFSKFGGERHGNHLHHPDGRPYATNIYKYSDIPPHHEIIGSPSVDVGNHRAVYQVIDHYYDGNHKTNEIGPYHRNSGNNYEEAPTTRPRDGYNGNYKHSGPVQTESSPIGWGQEYQGGGGGGGWSHQGPGHGWKGDEHTKFMDKAKDYFKNSDLSTVEKWFDISIGVFSFLAFGAYIIMLLYQVFTTSSGTSIAMLLGRSFKGAGEMFDTFFSKGPIGEAYMDEVETIVKRAMANVKRTWVTTSLTEKQSLKVKGEEGAN